MKKYSIILGGIVLSMFVANVAYANHSWGGYHWARTANPFTVKLGNNLTSAWNSFLQTASSDWSVSSVLDTSIVTGANKKNCGPVSGRVEVCDKTYGNNGWLGIASIWVSGLHITQGTVKVNDTYFNTPTYNTSAWKQFVVCQEIGHTFGLDHQDENFSNANLGTCMDYTNDPSGLLKKQLSNEHPNLHDYSQLETIYTHLDSFTTLLGKAVGASARTGNDENNDNDIDTTNSSEWGKETRKDKNGKGSFYERDFGKGNKVFTFVIWTE